MSFPSPDSQQILEAALQHLRCGRLREAEALTRHLLAWHPDDAGALHLLGLVAQQTGSREEAAALIRQAIAEDPHVAWFHQNLGNLLHEIGRYGEAVAAYRQAIELAPDLPLAHHNLGAALKAQGQLTAAMAAYDEALRLAPDLAETHNNRANILQQQGRLTEAVAAYRTAIALKPDYAMAHNNLGNALLASRQIEDAVSAFRSALALHAGFALAHNNLGTALKEQGREDDAIASFRQALAADPAFVLALTNLANALHDRGEVDEAILLHQRAVVSPATVAAVHSNYLVTLQYGWQSTARILREAHDGYEEQYAGAWRASWLRHSNSPLADRRLRLGFVSPHLHSHAVGFFLVQLLENLDRREFEVVCYSDNPNDDAMTSRLRTCAAAWHSTRNDSDEDLARRIREDQVDILFDLAGHTAGNRLLVFARKPAPIQITWLDYVGTTGLKAMDYILADPREIPPESGTEYREKVLRLPDDYICFDPPADAPSVGPLPAAATGSITFASFNIPPKTTPQVVEVWSRILGRLPTARMILKNRRFDHPAVVSRYRQLFGGHGIDRERISFQGWSQRADLLAAYGEVDIALDTFPYNGGLTTCEALWMGVPVVTCPGETFASRHGLAHLTAAGLPETIAHNLEEYVEIAVALASDLPRLSAMRAGLRQRVAASPLCDGSRFARHFATLMREVWQRWCVEEGANHRAGQISGAL